jgi:hypothetical protein
VTELRDAGGRLTRIAVIEPAVDLGQLEQVFVMMRRGPMMDLLYRPNRAESDLDGPARVSAGPPEDGSDGRASGSGGDAAGDSPEAAQFGQTLGGAP